MSGNVTVHCYVDQLISNDDGKYDTFGSSWFTVSSDWLLKQVLKSGYQSLEDFYSNYTYDDTDGLMELAIDEGELLGCGTGSMENYDGAENMNLNKYLSELIKERYPSITNQQLKQSTKGVRYWFDITVFDSIDDSISG